jgi:DNA-binding MarR family transcriptional regulator
MSTSNDELLKTLKEIRDLLIPISACFEDQYLEVQRQRKAEKQEAFRALLTPTRREIYPLLFDPRRLSQVEIAEQGNTTQPTVSKFVNILLEQGLIEQVVDEDRVTVYRDKYNLLDVLQDMEEE